MNLLIIRPQPGNDASAKRAREAGFKVTQFPFFKVRACPWSAPDPARYDALLITSANAIRHAGPQLDMLRHLPVHSVGVRSGDQARQAGLGVQSEGTADAAQALQAAADAGHHRLLWLAGEDHQHLAPPPDMIVDQRVVYASVPLEPDSAMAEAVLRSDVIALHSARAAQRLAALVEQWQYPRTAITIACFSQAISDAAGPGWRAVVIAERPEDSALLSAVQCLATVSDEANIRDAH
ncbi:uroporphyrinogen-III synthase [Sphingorhabdus pulchriflava]|uniref:Uroporphyrinogen-III synthase n=1 Tax=Sphingorhabdus pulchriflava TaxID=2292257 RepID=A0A371B222_9SPHN|nr:uroporphyrinogen-III synthase [Sphingorhabdus pulchriflava]RDV01600.1 uroporphyrinogen-III synthase [Sphingorhabdus pulchriflava]